MSNVNREKEKEACAIVVSVCAIGAAVAMLVAVILEMLKK